MAVTEAFVRLYNAGLLYRDRQLVNWSCALRSAISDVEVRQASEVGQPAVRVSGCGPGCPESGLRAVAWPCDSPKAVEPRSLHLGSLSVRSDGKPAEC